MEDIEKVSSFQLYSLWKNITTSLVTAIAMITFSKLLPFYLSPVISLIGAAFLYVYIYNSRAITESSCKIVPYAMMYCLLSYSFLSILLNVLSVWGVTQVPKELIFFTNPYLPSLLLDPVICLGSLVILLRLRKLQICIDCRLKRNGTENRLWESLLRNEIRFQLKNLTIVFGILSILIWTYYLVFYVNININSRDWYIFIWLTVIFTIFDVLYFVTRYYNLYLDMKESNELITQDQISDMTARTYLRYYVICGNHIYVDPHAIDPDAPYREVIDTPFFTKRIVNGISADEVKKIIQKMTGYDNGELRFFYGRKSDVIHNHSLLRYFYFLDGDISQYENMNVDGEWMDYEKIKYLYSNNPGKLADISVTDTTRLATILLTEKTFDENGFRKSKIRMYNPTFNLVDVRKSNLDFQDDKWIEISIFNSDTPLFRIKRWWRKINGTSRKNKFFR